MPHPATHDCRMADFKQHWRQRTVETDAGTLEWTVFPGPTPFVGCTRLAGRPISPVDGHRLLADIEHPAAELDLIGGGWATRDVR